MSCKKYQTWLGRSVGIEFIWPKHVAQAFDTSLRSKEPFDFLRVSALKDPPAPARSRSVICIRERRIWLATSSFNPGSRSDIMITRAPKPIIRVNGMKFDKWNVLMLMGSKQEWIKALSERKGIRSNLAANQHQLGTNVHQGKRAYLPDMLTWAG